MSGDDAEVLAALKQRRVLIPSPWVQGAGLQTEPETDVHRCYDVPIVIDGSRAHFANAKAWSHSRAGVQPDPYVWVLHFLMLCVENTKCGGPSTNLDKGSQGDLYKGLLRAMYDIKNHRKSPAVEFYRNNYLNYEHYVDRELARDYEIFEKAERLKKKTKGKNAGIDLCQHDGEEEEQQQQEDPELAALNRAMDEVKNAVENYVKRHSAWDVLYDRHQSHSFYTHEEHWEDTVFFPALGIAPTGCYHHQELQKRRALRRQPEAVEDGAAMKEIFADFEGQARVPKVQVCVIPIPRAGAIPTGEVGYHHGDCIGYLVRFLVKDKSWKVAATWNALMAELRKLEKNSAAVKFAPDWVKHYVGQSSSNHPVHLNTTLETYYRIVTAIDPTIANHEKGAYKDANPGDLSSPVHLVNVLTTERALHVLADAGGDPAVLQNASETHWKCYRFPPTLAVYKYLPHQVFWHHPRYVGWSEQYFPDVDWDSDFIAALYECGNVADFLQSLGDNDNAEQELEYATNEIRRILSTHHRVVRDDMLRSKLVGYDTNNEFVHQAARAKAARKRMEAQRPAHMLQTLVKVQQLVKWAGEKQHWKSLVCPAELRNEYARLAWYDRSWPPQAMQAFETPEELTAWDDPELMAKVEQCEDYLGWQNRMHDACMTTFESLWQLEGDVSQLPIPDTIRAMLKWFQDNRKRFPNVTREFVYAEEAISVFGNAILRKQAMYSCLARVLQPVICLLLDGLYSAYYWAPGQLKGHLVFHGRYDVGKTYAAIKMLCDFITIPGTVREISSATAAADKTLRHVYDQIIASDEMQPFEVCKKEAEKVPERENAEKVKMTRNQIGVQRFGWREIGGRRVAWYDDILTDHHYAKVATTNKEVESKEALTSRYFQKTVSQVDTPVNEMNYEISTRLGEDARTFLQLEQFLSAAIYKGIMCGALPDIDMQLFDDISNEVIDVLRARKTIADGEGARQLELMRPHVRQKVVANAIHCCYDLPTGANYKRPFTTRDLREVAPYLYCTIDIVYYVWTSMASQWVDENLSNVLRAATKAVGIDDWPEGESAYTIYEHENYERGRIPWRTRYNPNFVESQGHEPGDEQLVDLDYLTLRATSFEQLCQNISTYTSPHLSSNDVSGILKQLQKKQLVLPNGGFEPQPKGTFKKWHRFKERDENGHIVLFKETGMAMPPEYRQRTVDHTKERKKEDVPSRGGSAKMPVVEIVEQRQAALHFMPAAAFKFREDEVLQALHHATLCGSLPAHKVILGSTEEGHPERLDCDHLTEDLRDWSVSRIDLARGWRRDVETGQLVWTGPPETEMSKAERPIPRARAMTFTRRGTFTQMEQQLLTHKCMAPTEAADNGDSWRKIYKSSFQGVDKAVEVVPDMDEWSAQRQHLKCGLPLGEPVKSPAYILELYKKHCESVNCTPFLGHDYPKQLQREKERLEGFWKRSRTGLNTAVMRETQAEIDAEFRRRRKQRQPRGERQQQQQRRHRRRHHDASTLRTGAVFNADRYE